MTPRKRVPIPGVTVYPRGKRFSYRIELEKDPLTLERRWEYQHGFETEEIAWTEALRAKAAIETGQRVAPSRRTMADYLTDWLSSLEGSVKPSTETNYRDYIDAYVDPYIGKRKLQSIDVPTLNTLYQRLLASGRKKADRDSVMYAYWQSRQRGETSATPADVVRHCDVTIHAARRAVARYKAGRTPSEKPAGLAPKTVKNVHRMLHRALSDAVAWRYIEYNPATHANLPRQDRRRHRRTGAAWTGDEIAAWLDIAMKDRDAALWLLVATTGMRRSELAGVEATSVDLQHLQLRIQDTRVVVDGKAIDSDGKTRSSWRTISIDEGTVAALERHVRRMDEELIATGADPRGPRKLFCHPDGSPLHPDTITRRFNRLVDAAGVPKIRLHDVRHSYATLALDLGVEPKVLADRMGHASMAYTLQIYTHRTTGRDREAARAVAQAIAADPNPHHQQRSPSPNDQLTPQPTSLRSGPPGNKDLSEAAQAEPGEKGAGRGHHNN